jgi:hypothetical protein
MPARAGCIFTRAAIKKRRSPNMSDDEHPSAAAAGCARAPARDNNPVCGDIIFGNVTKEEYFMNDFYGLIENVMRFYYCFISHFQRQ